MSDDADNDAIHPHALDHCPYCNHPCNFARQLAQPGVAPRPPQPGDHTFCMECGAMAVLDENVRRRQMTTAELNELGEPARHHLEEMKKVARMFNELERRSPEGN